MERLEECPLKGMLGRRRVGTRSKTKEELRFDVASKCPDRFSRSVLCNAKPESFRETGVVGREGNALEVGESLGEGGKLPFVVEPVFGRSAKRGWSLFAWRNALKIGGRGAKLELASPKDVEFKLTNLARELRGASSVKIEGFSEEKASKG